MVTIESDNNNNNFLFYLSIVTREYQIEYLIYNST